MTSERKDLMCQIAGQILPSVKSDRMLLDDAKRAVRGARAIMLEAAAIEEPRREAYLALEEAALISDRFDESLAERVRTVMDVLWLQLSADDRKFLDRRTLS